MKQKTKSKKVETFKTASEPDREANSNGNVIDTSDYETTDLSIVHKLNKLGHFVKAVKSPFGERRVKLYVFDYKVRGLINE